MCFSQANVMEIVQIIVVPNLAFVVQGLTIAIALDA